MLPRAHMHTCTHLYKCRQLTGQQWCREKNEGVNPQQYHCGWVASSVVLFCIKKIDTSFASDTLRENAFLVQTLDVCRHKRELFFCTHKKKKKKKTIKTKRRKKGEVDSANADAGTDTPRVIEPPEFTKQGE